MLSRRDRKARHLAVAAWLEATLDPNDDVAGVVAQHYLDAVDSSVEGDSDVPELVATATRLLERAAVRAMALGAHAEAVRYLTRAQERDDRRGRHRQDGRARSHRPARPGPPGVGP